MEPAEAEELCAAVRLAAAANLVAEGAAEDSEEDEDLGELAVVVGYARLLHKEGGSGASPAIKKLHACLSKATNANGEGRVIGSLWKRSPPKIVAAACAAEAAVSTTQGPLLAAYKDYLIARMTDVVRRDDGDEEDSEDDDLPPRSITLLESIRRARADAETYRGWSTRWAALLGALPDTAKEEVGSQLGGHLGAEPRRAVPARLSHSATQ